MARQMCALAAILVEAGFQRHRAVHFAAVIDRQRINGLGSDDYAAALCEWAQLRRSKQLEERARAWSAIPEGLPDVPGQQHLQF